MYNIKMVLSFKKFTHSLVGSLVCNILLSYIIFFVARLVFFVANVSYFIDYMSWPLLGSMLQGALVFDTSAVIYCNLLYIVMVLFPLIAADNNSLSIVLAVPGSPTSIKPLFPANVIIARSTKASSP